jgi:hypothetical protein
MFRKLQNLQNLNNIGKLNSIFKESTQNLKRQGFTKLLQTNRSKCRSNFVDHVSKVRFEVWDLDLCGSRVLGENPRENRVRAKNAHFRFYIAQCLDTISACSDTHVWIAELTFCNSCSDTGIACPDTTSRNLRLDHVPCASRHDF